MKRLGARLVLVLILVLPVCFCGCKATGGLDAELNRITGGYRFNLPVWEIRTLSQDFTGMLASSKAMDDIQSVLDYFSLAEQIGALEQQIELTEAGIYQGDTAPLIARLASLRQQSQALENGVEKTLEGQIRQTLSRLGIYNPLDSFLKLDIGFPPVNFALESPPQLLVISPRDKIEAEQEILLLPDLSLEQDEAIEAAAEQLGVSALVVRLGGVATYPSFVANDSGLQFTLDTAIEEWLHQYLAFRPLGLLYVLDILGISPNYQIATMNETLASIASQEIGQIVYQDYYAAYEQPSGSQPQPSTSGFDFNAAMRTIRLTVDDLLAKGETDQAEAYMEQQRLYLLDNGYYIRKLNQAYFAFYGTYAGGGTSVDPIGTEMRQLRDQTGSVAAFLNQVSAMTNPEQLAASAGQAGSSG